MQRSERKDARFVQDTSAQVQHTLGPRLSAAAAWELSITPRFGVRAVVEPYAAWITADEAMTLRWAINASLAGVVRL